jgi:hypothetical protein
VLEQNKAIYAQERDEQSADEESVLVFKKNGMAGAESVCHVRML